MSELDKALARFDGAVMALETALEPVIEARGAAAVAVAAEIDALKQDRTRLETDMGSMHAELAMLEVFTDEIFEKVDGAITEIRQILEE